MNMDLDQSFYDSIKEVGGEQKYDILRASAKIGTITGIYAENTVTFPPCISIPIKVGDILSNKYSRLVVTNFDVYGAAQKVWQLAVQTEPYLKHKSDISVTNNFQNSQNVAQAIGSANSAAISQTNTYKISDLENMLSSVDDDDVLNLRRLIDQVKDMVSAKQSVKKGCFAKFERLVSKYPNISKIVSGIITQFLFNKVV